jgi:hypothetical protein
MIGFYLQSEIGDKKISASKITTSVKANHASVNNELYRHSLLKY